MDQTVVVVRRRFALVAELVCEMLRCQLGRTTVWQSKLKTKALEEAAGRTRGART